MRVARLLPDEGEVLDLLAGPQRVPFLVEFGPQPRPVQEQTLVGYLDEVSGRRPKGREHPALHERLQQRSLVRGQFAQLHGPAGVSARRVDRHQAAQRPQHALLGQPLVMVRPTAFSATLRASPKASSACTRSTSCTHPAAR